MQDRLDQARRLSKRHMQLQARQLAAKLQEELSCRAEAAQQQREDSLQRGRVSLREAELQREIDARLQARHEREATALERARHLEWATALQHLREQERLDARRIRAGEIRAAEKEQAMAFRRQQQEAVEQRQREHEARLECERQRKAAEYDSKIERINLMEAARDNILEDLKRSRMVAYGRYDALQELFHESSVVNNDDLLRRLLENDVPKLSSIPHTPRSSISDPILFTKPRSASVEPVSTPRPRLSSHKLGPSSPQRAASARARVSSPKRTTSASGRVSSPKRPTSARGTRSLISSLSTTASQRSEASSRKTLANSFVSKVSLDSRSTSAASLSGSGVASLIGSSDSPAAPVRSKIPLVLRETGGCSKVMAQPTSLSSPRNFAGPSTKTSLSSTLTPRRHVNVLAAFGDHYGDVESLREHPQDQPPGPVELVVRIPTQASGSMATAMASGVTEQACTPQHIFRTDNYLQFSTPDEDIKAVRFV